MKWLFIIGIFMYLIWSGKIIINSTSNKVISRASYKISGIVGMMLGFSGIFIMNFLFAQSKYYYYVCIFFIIVMAISCFNIYKWITSCE